MSCQKVLDRKNVIFAIMNLHNLIDEMLAEEWVGVSARQE